MTQDARSKTDGLGRRLLEKALLPVVAAAATAATTYAARKTPHLLDERLGPKLRELAGDSGDLAGELTGRVTSVAETPSRRRSSTRTLSTDELARRRAERERRRSSRSRTSR